MISVVILAMNEAENLPRCLASVDWCDEILLVDSGSTDATVAIAESVGARVISRTFDTFARQRNHAMEQGNLRNDWVLHLDADEVVPPALRDELIALAAPQGACHGVYRVPSRLLFMGRWLRYSGMYPAYQVRFGRRDRLRFIDHGHGQRESAGTGEVGTITSPLDHYNFSKGSLDWFERHLRYARAEAEQALAERGENLQFSELFSGDASLRRRALKRLANRLPLRPVLRFCYSYIVRLGFLDGRAGFRYARMLGIYQYFIDMNIVDLRARR